MSLFDEKYYPFVFTALITGAWLLFGEDFFPIDVKEFIAAALSYSAVLAGFLATALAILMALPSDSVMAKLRTSGYIDELAKYMGDGIYASMFFSIVNLLGFFLIDSSSSTPKLPIAFQSIWIIGASLSTLTFVRVATILLHILKHPPP